MKIPVLCKKVSDPPQETVGEWEQTNCVICTTGLRTTTKATQELKERDMIPVPVCFECALMGPKAIWKAVEEYDTN